MQRRRKHRMSTHAALGALTIAAVMTFGWAQNASAQVVIDMPPPRPKPRVVAPPPPAPPEAATPATVLDAPAPRIDPQPGALALQQYARTRYFPDDRYGLRRYRRPFTPGDFSHSFALYGLHAPFHVIAPPQVIIVQPSVFIKPPGFGK